MKKGALRGSKAKSRTRREKMQQEMQNRGSFSGTPCSRGKR